MTGTETEIPESTISRIRDAIWAAAPGLDAGTVDDATVRIIDSISPTTLFHRYIISRKQTEAAVEIIAAQHAEAEKLRRMFRLDHNGGRIVDSLDLGNGSWVVEIEDHWAAKSRSSWHVAHEGKDTSHLFDSLDAALLRVIELRHNGGNPNGQGAFYAARMLNVDNTRKEEN
jgi:hypothetical protein